MTLNASGPISLGGSTAGQSINLELGKAATAQVSMNDTNVRSLAGVPSGQIVMPTNFWGKSAAGALAVTASDMDGVGQGFGFTGPVSTQTSTNTTVTGGTGPYTYFWELTQILEGFIVPVITSNTAQNPGWSYSSVEDGFPSRTVWKVTVTDATTATAFTTITVALTWINLN